MRRIFLALAFLAGAIASPTERSPCGDLSGLWRNELGSNMTIRHFINSEKIFGTYSTAVESSRGAAAITSNVTGMFHPVEGGSLVAFNVLWNKGASLTAWVGQCSVCNGKVQLFTTWVLRSLMPAKKSWMSTRINEDTFYRVQDVQGEPALEEPTGGHESNAALTGKWYSTTGDSVDFSLAGDQYKCLHGAHQIAGIDNASPLFGQFNGNETYTALGFVSSCEEHITGWTGHIYNPADDQPILQTSWLSHEFSDRCNIPRKDMEYGMDNYSKN